MPDRGDKLSAAHVQALIDRASSPSPGRALAARRSLRDALRTGEAAFVDQVTYAAARKVVDTFLND